MIANIRQISQQLLNPCFNSPKEVVSWMGAIQGQDYAMAKWAVGIRLKSPTLRAVEDALARGEIIRTHVMRPTWHLVAAEDTRWMLKLSAHRIKSANDSFAKGHGVDISEALFSRCNRLIEKLLEGNKSLTKQEIEAGLANEGMTVDNRLMTRFMARAEVEGIVCSGVDKGKKATYALLEERVPPVKELTKDEALATLALRYFRSHSPASLTDFVWWSGLSVTEARTAMGLIDSQLVKERFDSYELFVHESYQGEINSADILHFLPSYDEYLISYKERKTVLAEEHHPKAFNTYGIFYPVILYNGKVVGNWKKTVGKNKKIEIVTSFFEGCPRIHKEMIEQAESRLRVFYSESD